MIRGRLYLSNITLNSEIKQYEGLQLFRSTGRVEITEVKIGKVGDVTVNYTEINSKTEMITHYIRDFMVPVIYLPFEDDEDAKFRELHSASWEEAEKILPRNKEGLFIPGIDKVPNQKVTYFHQDEDNFLRISKPKISVKPAIKQEKLKFKLFGK